jgi:hypothetical protein
MVLRTRVGVCELDSSVRGKNQCRALLVKGMKVASVIVQCEGRIADRL